MGNTGITKAKGAGRSQGTRATDGKDYEMVKINRILIVYMQIG